MFISIREPGVRIGIALFLLATEVIVLSQEPPKTVRYLNLTTPRRVLTDAQKWEGNEFPHTMSVLDLKRDGFRYWGWYGLNEGRGIGLARSNDLVNWTKYKQNPLWMNARWPSVLAGADPKHTDVLYFAITREYDTPSSHIVLASSHDGIHMTEEKVLVAGVPNQRNQNPNLFRDPRTGRFYLTFYRGNDKDHFEIISKGSDSVIDLDKAPEKILLKSETHDRGAHPPLSDGHNERQRQEGWSLLSSHGDLPAPLHRGSGRRVAGEGLRGRFAGWRFPARGRKSRHARPACLPVPAHFQRSILWI